jgi:hypothetical protein
MSPKREVTYDDLVELRIDDMTEEDHAADLGSSVEPEQLDLMENENG